MSRNNQARTSFKGLFDKSPDPVGLCFKLVLLWIAICDGSLDKGEYAFLQKVFGASSMDSDIDRLVKIIEQEVLDSGEAYSLEIASGFLKKNIDTNGKRLLLEMIIGISVTDGRLSISENHILRFLADLFGLSAKEFEGIYTGITGLNFPAPGNPDSRQWWEEKLGRNHDRESDANAGDEGAGSGEYFSNSEEMSVAEALIVLGLRGRPTPVQVKAAYRKLAKKHHPDKFARLGTDTLRFANSMFQRINQAYEVLSRNERSI